MTGMKQLQAQYYPQILKLVLIKSCYFITQIICFWLFSAMMYQLIVKQSSFSTQQLSLFGISALFWLLTKHIVQQQELALNLQVTQTLNTKVNRALETQQHVLAQQYSSFHWQQIFLKHIPALGAYISQYLTQKYLSVVIPLIALVAVFTVNWIVALVLILTLPLIPVFMVLVGYGAANMHRKHFVSLERLGGLFIDRLKALTTITVFNQHKNQTNLLNTASRLVNKQTMQVVSLAFLSTTVLDFFATISIALVAVFIGFTLLGEVSLGPLIDLQQGLFLLLLAPLLFSELKHLGRLYHQKAEAEAAWDSLSPIIELPTNSFSQQRYEEFNTIDWVNFNLDEPTLHAKKLQLKKGQSVNLQGASGAGKSVFLQALMGLKVASHQLNGKCVLLGQSPVILPYSVRKNLSLGHDVSEHQLWQVLAQVNLENVIKGLPEGIDTPLGEYPPLSGGELQRLMLARLLLQPCDVILLDEPTAHLPENQHMELSQLIYQLTRNKTVIWVSHKALPKDWFDQAWQIESNEIKIVQFSHLETINA